MYILKDGKPIKIEQSERGLREYVVWYNKDENRRVALTKFGDSIKVSTVFLSIDHNHGVGEPLLWETMIFGGVHDLWQERASTREQALLYHEEAVTLVTQSLQNKLTRCERKIDA